MRDRNSLPASRNMAKERVDVKAIIRRRAFNESNRRTEEKGFVGHPMGIPSNTDSASS